MAGTAVSSEIRFLIAALRADTSLRTAQPLEQPGIQSLHWEAIIQAATWHGVAALLARRLHACGLMTSLPGEARKQLEQQVRALALRSMSQVGALLEVQRAMDQAGVRSVAWKGPALAKDLYGNHTLRASSDLDFLLPHAQMADAVRVLINLGFVPSVAWATAAAGERANRVNCEVQLSRTRDQVRIELHDEVMPRLFGRGMSIDQCVGRARRMALEGSAAVRVLAPGDLLISLCSHGAKHGWERLKWVCDTAAFLDRYAGELSWEELLAGAREASALDAVLGGIRLAGTLLGAPEPEQVRRCTERASAVGKTVAAVTEELTGGVMEPKSARLAVRYGLQTAGTHPARARYLARRMLTIGAPDVEAFQLPEKLVALYLPLRVFRIVTKVVRGALGKRVQAVTPGNSA